MDFQVNHNGLKFDLSVNVSRKIIQIAFFMFYVLVYMFTKQINLKNYNAMPLTL